VCSTSDLPVGDSEFSTFLEACNMQWIEGVLVWGASDTCNKNSETYKPTRAKICMKPSGN
jgi:hypothetical protein